MDGTLKKSAMVTSNKFAPLTGPTKDEPHTSVVNSANMKPSQVVIAGKPNGGNDKVEGYLQR